MAVTVTDILNQWNNIGVFSYVIPFLLIFAIVYALLEKTGLLSRTDSNNKPEHNKPILAIISVAVALLALQFDMVSVFFAEIFPRFGIGLSIFLVLVILIGFFVGTGTGARHTFEDLGWIGWVTGIGVVIWALSSWDSWTSYGGFGGWFADYIWSLLILGGVIALIFWAAGPRGRTTGT